jgi:hypothetical protein
LILLLCPILNYYDLFPPPHIPRPHYPLSHYRLHFSSRLLTILSFDRFLSQFLVKLLLRIPHQLLPLYFLPLFLYFFIYHFLIAILHDPLLPRHHHTHILISLLCEIHPHHPLFIHFTLYFILSPNSAQLCNYPHRAR